MQALFADDVMTRYHGSFLFEPVRARAAGIFDETITALAASGKRVLKVLEVGAGTAIA